MTEPKLPKISIITPSFNQGQYLEETILSVLEQGYPALEFFIFDGGSTDGSLDIIQKHQDQLTFWESKPDRGQSHAINKGFRMASGEIVAWLNSDDLLAPGALKVVAQAWQQNPGVGLISGQTEIIDQVGKPTGNIFGSEPNVINSLLSSENPISQPSTFFSTSALKEVGFLDETLHMSMDWDLWLRIGARYPTLFIPKILSKSRNWEMTKTRTQLVRSGPEHIRIVKNFIKQNPDFLTPMQKRQALGSGYLRKGRLDYEAGKWLFFRLDLLIAIYYGMKPTQRKDLKLFKHAFPVFYFSKRVYSYLYRKMTTAE
ncbi:MAG TPA: glycosyltransferase family 2 protein [Anaerolineaceae bacterium]|nr:glycosyltransferase [Anaerolineaceae bacterium]HOV30192.1 glycosyltransferase family 2 protein [Anaerolineaceae bacterium]HUM49666.1 glycosyltransferase family 2 protein [Anaerolineaceae bacterium]